MRAIRLWQSLAVAVAFSLTLLIAGVVGRGAAIWDGAVVPPDVDVALGGLHLVAAPDSVVQALSLRLHDTWHLDAIAPGHCTGEPAFKALKAIFGDRYRYAGLGTRLLFVE